MNKSERDREWTVRCEKRLCVVATVYTKMVYDHFQCFIAFRRSLPFSRLFPQCCSCVTVYGVTNDSACEAVHRILSNTCKQNNKKTKKATDFHKSPPFFLNREKAFVSAHRMKNVCTEDRSQTEHTVQNNVKNCSNFSVYRLVFV